MEFKTFLEILEKFGIVGLLLAAVIYGSKVIKNLFEKSSRHEDILKSIENLHKKTNENLSEIEDKISKLEITNKLMYESQKDIGGLYTQIIEVKMEVIRSDIEKIRDRIVNISNRAIEDIKKDKN